jgi:hypothetical protein
MALTGMRTLSVLFCGSLILSAISLTLFNRVRQRRRREVKIMSESEFVEIMRILAKRIFLALFSLAQVSARVIPKPDDNKSDSIRSDNPGVRCLLSNSQAQILKQFHLESEDLEHAQSLFYHTGNSELDAIVDSIPVMFEQFASGSFPVLPYEVLAITSLPTQPPLIDILREILITKANPSSSNNKSEDSIIAGHGFPCSISFYNEVAKRMRSDSDFRNQLIQILIKNQTIVRSKLDE